MIQSHNIRIQLIRTTLILLTLVLLKACHHSPVPNKEETKGAEKQPATRSYSTRTLLNSERIEARYGNYAISLLKNEERVRLSNLYSVNEDNAATTRTLALVLYPLQAASEFAEEHQMILNGHSIGSTFKANGWDIYKQHRYFGEIEVAVNPIAIHSYMGPFAETHLAAHIYDFYISRGKQSYRYASISELHHPDYLSKVDLNDIYGAVLSQDEKYNIQAINELIRTELSSLRPAAVSNNKKNN